MYTKYTCRLSFERLVSDDIAVHAGVWEGCLLWPLLFLVVVDLDNANDLYLLSQKRTDMQTKIDDLKKEAEITLRELKSYNSTQGIQNDKILSLQSQSAMNQ